MKLKQNYDPVLLQLYLEHLQNMVLQLGQTFNMVAVPNSPEWELMQGMLDHKHTLEADLLEPTLDDYPDTTNEVLH